MYTQLFFSVDSLKVSWDKTFPGLGKLLVLMANDKKLGHFSHEIQVQRLHLGEFVE